MKKENIYITQKEKEKTKINFYYILPNNTQNV
jgi:hypothetical protein